MRTEKAETNQIMTIREVADYLRMGESTVYRLANKGKLPGRKIGGGWRFSRKEL
ncbi:MAG: helix-turn-helix domain-containing protein, partial [Candidatus Promineifilaceae bacterium]